MPAFQSPIARASAILGMACLLAAGVDGQRALSADLRVIGLSLAPSATGVVRLELAASTPVVGVQLDLLYPSDQITLGPADRGDALGNHVLKGTDVGPGRRRLLIYSATSQTLSNGVLAELPVAHFGSLGTFPLTLANALAATPQGRPDQPLRLFPSELVAGSALAPVLAGIAFGADGRVHFHLMGTSGRTYRIQGSTDLRTWTDLRDAAAEGAVLEIEDLPPVGLRYRFYRAVQAP